MKKMENKIGLATMLVMVMLLVVPMISAAGLTSTWNAKGATALNYTNLTGSFTWNCTATAKAVTNVTIYANSSSGVMNPLQSFANTSANQAAWTGTVTITAADDGSNQNLTCYIRNATAAAYSVEKSAVRIRLDTTAPKCNVSVAHTTIPYKGNQIVSYASSDVLARRTTTLDIDGPGKQTTITVTAATRNVELGSNDTKYTGSWTANMTVTDWSGNSCTDSVTFKTYLADGEIDEEETTVPTTNNGKKLLIIAAIVGVIWYLARKK